MNKKTVSIEELLNKHDSLAEGEVILDVRNVEEFESGHIPGSLNIPLSILASEVEKLKAYNMVYIHCLMGGRAKKAFDLLTEMGVNNLCCLQDCGMQAWTEKGYPVER